MILQNSDNRLAIVAGSEGGVEIDHADFSRNTKLSCPTERVTAVDSKLFAADKLNRFTAL